MTLSPEQLTPEQSLFSYIAAKANATRFLGLAEHPSVYFAIESMGKVFAPQPRPSSLPKQKDKECFSNALHLSCESDLVYCEGIARGLAGVPVHHAWCADSSGRVIDPTWAEPEKCTYIGIPFLSEFAVNFAEDSGLYGIFENYKKSFDYRHVPQDVYLHPLWNQILSPSCVKA